MCDPEVLWLTSTVLFHDPTADYRFKSGPRRTPPPGSGRYPVPEQKSLLGTGNERGLPMGNLTSQFWANVYLNELDQFVKLTLRCQYYVRYVDDLVLLDTDAERLRQWRDAIAAYGKQPPPNPILAGSVDKCEGALLGTSPREGGYHQ